ncbi:hypothetical protein K6L44_09265 [Gluconacetobacter entanii]|uniref:hypothetical protein n=1 Tax=Gluconacetobacter entanii TaxID=108528 RepID=UPI001C93445D|nr:hypothetical protein [Gluconacetobacter entanii]MBY4640171.1 hypothetical protein [Gluconacetobacter entanii]MCW4580441.1 hypothetical protein [Gluconacetobacter entanii]MCW4583825.1 hypothetical protein [Gluconacetobacter entanii]MCW4587116.1 hypothetical protein [Gluconacetobacter entanii]
MITSAGLLALWTTYGKSVCTLAGGIAGWAGNVMRIRIAAQRGRLDTGQQAPELLARASERDTRMDALLVSMTERISELTRQRWRYDGVLQELYA